MALKPLYCVANRTLEFSAAEDTANAFARTGPDKSKRRIVYRSGEITVPLDSFLLHQLGYDEFAIYDISIRARAKGETLPNETLPIETLPIETD